MYVLEVPTPEAPYVSPFFFSLQPAVFELHAIFRQVHLTTSEWYWTFPSPRTPCIYQVLTGEAKMFVGFALRQALFSEGGSNVSNAREAYECMRLGDNWEGG